MKRIASAVTFGVLGVLALPACAASAPVPPAAVAKRTPGPPLHSATLELDPDETEGEIGDLGTLRFVGMGDGPVPDFRVTAVGGEVFDSQALVGTRAFVVVFFATWCGVCELKMPALHEALARLGNLIVIGVSLDGPQTWGAVTSFLQRYELAFPVVRAAANPRFAVSYNPFSGVPAVVVVGRNGGLVDVQMGYSPDDGQKLVDSVELARRIGPLKKHVD